MKYENSEGKQFLIYCYSSYRNTWKIENLPFDGTVREMDEQSKDNFIRMNRLKRVEE